MMRRRFGLVALALLSLGAGLLASPAPVGAATVTKSGWWSHTSDPGTLTPPAAQTPIATVPELPAPAPRPDVPEGSLLVEGQPEGATAVAALTWSLTEGESAPVLTVTPSDSSNVPADAVILACRAAVEWTTPDTSPGPWGDKPLVDCGSSVQGIPNEDGTIGFGLGPLVSGNTLDVVLTPGVAQTSPATVGSTFSLSFSASEGAVLQTSVSSTPSTPSFSAPAPAPSGAPPPAYSAPSSSFSAPSIAAPVAQPALPPEAQAPAVPQQTALPATAPASSNEDNGPRGVAFLILLAGLALAGLASATPTRAEDGTIGLGRFKRPVPAQVLADPVEPVPGGLGRFVRPRTGPPPKLS